MNLKKIIQAVFSKRVITDALVVCIVVGSILNFVNQGDLIVRFQFEKLSTAKLILTYFVPYAVSTFSSVKTKLSLNLEEECKKQTDETPM